MLNEKFIDVILSIIILFIALKIFSGLTSIIIGIIGIIILELILYLFFRE